MHWAARGDGANGENHYVKNNDLQWHVIIFQNGASTCALIMRTPLAAH
jgi:hypothetical protein